MVGWVFWAFGEASEILFEEDARKIEAHLTNSQLFLSKLKQSWIQDLSLTFILMMLKNPLSHLI